MHDKAKELFAAFKAGRMSRRELMSGAAKLGVSAATANFLLNAAATQALAADFDWKKFKGTKLHFLLNKHPYADAMIEIARSHGTPIVNLFSSTRELYGKSSELLTINGYHLTERLGRH